jgi:hypothetical protein
MRSGTGELAGRSVVHMVDGQGVAVPVGAGAPLPTSTTAVPATWSATAAAANSLAVATRPGEAGKSHHITTVLASFSGSATARLQIKDGGTVIAEHYVANGAIISLAAPRKATAGNSLSAELAAGGLGITGSVTLLGFTS